MIHYLKIENYRSIDILELRNVSPFSVFVGPNGSGKSNFFNALDFVSLVTRFNVKEALKRHGGFENVYCARRDNTKQTTFEFKIQTNLREDVHEIIINLESRRIKMMRERMRYLRMRELMRNLVKDLMKERKREMSEEEEKEEETELIRDLMGVEEELMRKMEGKKIVKAIQTLENLRLYRIEPRGIKQPNTSMQDASELHCDGRNLAAVLHRLERKKVILRETIKDWMELVVPGLETVQTQTERLDGSTLLAFKEQNTEKLFPAHLISDGTIYLLSLLVAILDRPQRGITLIEEPERGLHPKAIAELVQLCRDQATTENPIWLTTHNEAVVRNLHNNELWLVDKQQGVTTMRQVMGIDKLNLPVDEAWLSNVFNGGLPW